MMGEKTQSTMRPPDMQIKIETEKEEMQNDRSIAAVAILLRLPRHLPSLNHRLSVGGIFFV